MVLVFLVIAVVIMVIGFWIGLENDSEGWLGLGTVGFLGFVACIIAIFCLWSSITKGSVIDERIEMYQEQNQKIETQIAECVSQYQAYESGVFKAVAPESAITLVALYPDLKADALVQTQIETYTSNNNTIRDLKDQQIMLSVKKHWLYFGN